MWLVYVIGGFFGVLALVMIVGWLLPEKYEGRVTLMLDKSPEEVWAALVDYRKHPISSSMCRGVEDRPADPGGLPVWVEDLGSTKLDVTTKSATPPTRLKVRARDRVVPMTADTEIEIARTAGGVRITATNQTRIRRGTWHVPVFRLIMTLTKGAEKSLRRYFQNVAKSLGTTAQFQ